MHQKIYSHITPSPTNIFIKEIHTDEGNIFILDIPQSSTPPHQSNSDGRYYIRIDTEAKPAPHGLVQALFDKRRKPRLQARVQRKTVVSQTHFEEITWSLINDSVTPADKVSYIIDLYNVDATDNKEFYSPTPDTTNHPKLSYLGNIPHVLVEVVSFGFTFRIKPKSLKYLISIYYWSIETSFDMMYFLVDIRAKTVTAIHWLEEGVTVEGLLKKLA